MNKTPCLICNKRLLNHEKVATCSLCKRNTHIRCLPNYNKDDIDYAKNDTENRSCPTCLKTIFPFHQIEDHISLKSTLSNNTNNAYDLDTLQNMVYDPLDSNTGDGVGVLQDVDPDENNLNELRGNQIQNCQYYFSDTNIHEIQDKIESIELSVFHMNIRSFLKNFDELIPVLHQSQIKYNLIALTETWLKTNKPDSYL
jgi:hypothetical protein